MKTMRDELKEMAAAIIENGNRVPDAVCYKLHDMMWSHDLHNPELRLKLGTIWGSSKCANGDMVALALDMLANTLC